jgi:hypothetical protein
MRAAMLKSIKPIVIVVLAVFILWAPVKIGISIYDFYSYFHPTDAQKKRQQQEDSFLNGVNFNNGEYALIISKPDEARIITDRTTLEANRYDVTTKFDLTKYLPAERPAGFSLELFKDGKSIKSDVVYQADKLEISDALWKKGRTVHREQFTLERNAYTNKIAELNDKYRHVYWISEQAINPAGIDVQFSLKFPTIAQKAGTEFDSNAYADNLKKRLSDILSKSGPFILDVTSGSSTGKQALTNGEDGYDFIRAPDGQPGYVGIEDFDMYFFYADVRANQATYRYVEEHKIDIENLVTADRNRDLVIEARARIARENNLKIPINSIGIADYQDKIEIWNRQEIQYSAEYWKTED